MLLKNDSIWLKMQKNIDISECSFRGTHLSFEK